MGVSKVSLLIRIKSNVMKSAGSRKRSTSKMSFCGVTASLLVHDFHICTWIFYFFSSLHMEEIQFKQFKIFMKFKFCRADLVIKSFVCLCSFKCTKCSWTKQVSHFGIVNWSCFRSCSPSEFPSHQHLIPFAALLIFSLAITHAHVLDYHQCFCIFILKKLITDVDWINCSQVEIQRLNL